MDRYLASGGRDNMLRFWDLAAGVCGMCESAHTRPVLSIALNPAGTMLVSGAGDNRALLWAIR